MISAPPRTARGDRFETGVPVAPATPETIPTVEVQSIIGAGREAVILHKGERYRLRITANDKLILTK
jgi:hemin uptake protein HemP